MPPTPSFLNALIRNLWFFPFPLDPLIEPFRGDEVMRKLFTNQSNPFIQRERFGEWNY